MFKSRILDTLVFKGSEIHLLKYHIDRTFEAYQFLNIFTDKTHIASVYSEIQKKYSDKINKEECLRLVFSHSAPLEYTAEVQKITALNNPVRLQIYQLEKHQEDLFKFKWENRKYWDEMSQQKDSRADDLLVINPAQQLVETTRFNIFAYSDALNTVYTPELSSGCMNGTFRRYALDQKQIELPGMGLVKIAEKNIMLNEIENYRLYVANSVREVLKAELLSAI